MICSETVVWKLTVKTWQSEELNTLAGGGGKVGRITRFVGKLNCPRFYSKKIVD